MTMKIKKGDIIYLFEPLGGKNNDHLKIGNRPYVVVSNNIGNHFSEIVMIVPLNKQQTNSKTYPMHTVLDEGRHVAICEQIYTIPKKQIERVAHHLTDEEMKNLNRALMVALGV